MPTVQEVQEVHTLWLCAVVSESTKQTLHGFFPFDRIPTHFIYIHTSKLYFSEACHIKNQ